MKGRLPGQGDGPDAISADITAIRITIPRSAGAYSLADLPERIAANVTVSPVTGEWMWTGRTDRDGYGRYGSEGAHRIVYRLLVGPIPPGYEIDHVKARGCTSRACCSPWCLEAVTRRVNTLRGTSFAAANAAKTMCDHGHEFDLFNTYYRPDGSRDCRKCTARRQREYQQRLRQVAVTTLTLFDLERAA